MGRLDRQVIEDRIEEGSRRARAEERRRIREQIKKESDSFFGDFKKFITKGNVLDLAVAVVIANAFNAIVNGLVKYIITPAITYMTSGVSINEWEYVIREEVLDAEGAVEISKISIQYGLWLQTILDFLIIAFSIFVAVRLIRGMQRKLNVRERMKQEAEEARSRAEEEKKAALAAEEARLREEAALAEKQEALEMRRACCEALREQSELLRRIAESAARKDAGV